MPKQQDWPVKCVAQSLYVSGDLIGKGLPVQRIQTAAQTNILRIHQEGFAPNGYGAPSHAVALQRARLME